jgi:hypothetical protein
MKVLRLIPVCIASMALILAQTPPATQAEQAAGAATKAEKKHRTKAKKAAEPGVSGTEVTPATGASGMTEKGASQEPAKPMARKPRTAPTGSASRAMPTVSESEIAAAKASGKVWVNTETGVYHKGGQWYGATKQGKFMTEHEAIGAGYRASKAKE